MATKDVDSVASSRTRGLKRNIDLEVVDYAVVASSRTRGLKQLGRIIFDRSRRSRPHGRVD